MSTAILSVVSGITDKSIIPLPMSTSIIGKSIKSDIVIDNNYVSRTHCKIRFEFNSFFISDLGSKNGTFVNDIRIIPKEEIRLNNNDKIVLSDKVEFVYSDNEDSTLEITIGRPFGKQSLVVDPGSRDVFRDGELLLPPLSRKEFDVLALLYENRDTAISREEIALKGWPERRDGNVGPQEIEQVIRRIRRRIEADPTDPIFIITMKGYGYKMPKH